MRQNTKTVVGTINATTNVISTMTAEFDTLGFSFAKLIVLGGGTGTVSSGTNNKVEEGDTTSSYATFAGYVQGTDWTGSTTTNSTALAKAIYAVDLRGRKRYLKVTATYATGSIGAVIMAELSNPADGISETAAAGAANAVGV
jgi:hypothetical protein